MPPISVLIKPASGKCNMKCKYCFYHIEAMQRETADYGFMTRDTIEMIVKKVLSFASGNASFSFQGGEPTLCGLDFFRYVVELQRMYNVNNVEIQNCIQTNGILINEEWASFLHENNFLVGISLDGFEKLHNLNRVDLSDNGTFKSVVGAIEKMNRFGTEYNILFVVTSQAAQYADKLYSYFESHNFNYLQFIPCIDDNESALQPYSLTPEAFASFLKQFFDRWYNSLINGRYISVRYFDNLVRIMLGTPPETCSMLGFCQCQFVFEADGSVYPCDFYVTDEWRMGNIREQEIDELYKSESAMRFIDSSLHVDPMCKKCRWFSLCRGGCRRDKILSSDEKIGRSRYCDAYKDFFAYAYPKLHKAAQFVFRARQHDNGRQKGGNF